MSIVTVKTVKRTFVDFVDFVDEEGQPGDESEDEDNVGLCTWPIFDLRSSSKESTSTRITSKESTSTSEEETRATCTPNNEEVHFDTHEPEMEAQASDKGATCEVDNSPSSPVAAEESLWQDAEDPASPCPVDRWQTSATTQYEADHSPTSPADAEESPERGDDDAAMGSPVFGEVSPFGDEEDPLSPCPVSRWSTAAASRYCEPPGLKESSPTVEAEQPRAEPSFLPAAPKNVPGEASPVASGVFSAPDAASITRLQQLRRQTALPAVTSVPLPLFGDASPQVPVANTSQPRAFGDVPPTAAKVGALAAATAVSRYAAGNTLSHAANTPPLPAASRAFGDAQPHPAKVGASYAAGNTLSIAANVPPLPPAGWPALPRAVAVAPQLPVSSLYTQPARAGVGATLPVTEAKHVALAAATKARDAQRRQSGFQREDPNRLERRRHPAKQRADGEQVGPREPLEERTTIMLRNIPNNYTRDMLHELIETRGFGVKCDFLYLPIDFHTQSNLGYAFVNLERAEDARTFWDVFEGFNKWAMRSKKVGSLRWSECQGLEANINRYRNSPVMGEAVPDRHKPAVYSDGQRIEFPAPTKPLRAPRIKQVAQK